MRREEARSKNGFDRSAKREIVFDINRILKRLLLLFSSQRDYDLSLTNGKWLLGATKNKKPVQNVVLLFPNLAFVVGY